MISDKITSFLFFFKEDEVAINEKSILDTLTLSQTSPGFYVSAVQVF